MKIYDYDSYEDYKKSQIDANVRKINNSYVDPNSLHFLLNYLVNELTINPKLILCHGTRRGLEQQYIIDFFKSIKSSPEVIGTEISHTATKYPNTIQWDFHDVKEEWIESTDIIYSNSFDHSYKPIECLDSWMSCLSDNGVCVLEYSKECDTKSGAIDSFGATLEEYKTFISEKYDIVDILDNIGIKDKGKTHQGIRYFIIIKNK